MRAKSLALLVIALGCGLVASIGITQVIAKRDSQEAAPSGDTQAIFVAVEDIAFGEPLASQAIRLEQWPKDKSPKGALFRIEDVEGRRARTKLYAGEPILENKLFAKGASEQGYSTLIPKGRRVVRVKVNNVSSGLILPGDRVDVLVHLRRNPSLGVAETATRTILQDVKVFAVDNVVETEGQDDKTISAQTVSLLVKPEHAELVMLAEELGNIRLIMRSPEDDQIVKVKGSTPGELFGAAEAEDRQNEGPSKETGTGASGLLALMQQLRAKKAAPGGAPGSPRPSTGRRTHRMQIVSGPEVKDVVLEADGDRSDSPSGFGWWKLGSWNPTPDFGQAAEMPDLDELITRAKQEEARKEEQGQRPDEEGPPPEDDR